MQVTPDVVSQGIVFSTILAGFCFVIATEIALREPVPETLGELAAIFFAVGITAMMGAGFGIIYFADVGNPKHQNYIASIYLLTLALISLMFVIALGFLFYKRFSGKRRTQIFIVLISIIAYIINIVFLSFLP